GVPSPGRDAPQRGDAVPPARPGRRRSRRGRVVIAEGGHMSRYADGIVDVDVHHRPRSAADIAPYLSKRSQELVKNNPQTSPTLAPPGLTTPMLTESAAIRSDVITEPGVVPGYDVDVLRDHLMDKYGYYKAILTHDIGEWPAHQNPYFARDVCRA